MKRYKGDFEKLVLFDGIEFLPPIIEVDMLKIPARKVSVMADHPSNVANKEIILDEANLIFNGVSKAIRTMYEYEENPMVDKFKNSYEVQDISSEYRAENINFELEGLMLTPLAFVEWSINAESFTLEIP